MAFLYDHVGARSVADLVLFFLLEDRALHYAQTSQVIANGLRFASKSFVSNMSMHEYLYIANRYLH